MQVKTVCSLPISQDVLPSSRRNRLPKPVVKPARDFQIYTGEEHLMVNIPERENFRNDSGTIKIEISWHVVLSCRSV